MKIWEWFLRFYIKHELMERKGVDVCSYLNYLVRDEYINNMHEIDRRLKCTKRK